MRQEEEYYVQESRKEMHMMTVLKDIETVAWLTVRCIRSRCETKASFQLKEIVPSDPKALEGLIRYDNKTLFERYGVSIVRVRSVALHCVEVTSSISR